MTDPQIPQRLLELAQQSRAPQELTKQGLWERFGDLQQVEIEVGQVWRARWQEVVALLLVLGVHRLDVTVAPVTIDPPVEDDRCLILHPDRTVFGVDVTLWAGLAGLIPTRVLDCPVDSWDEDIVGWAASAETASPRREPAGTRRGREALSVFTSDALARAEIEDDLHALRAAPALPMDVADRPFRALASILGKNLKLDALCSALGMQQFEVMKLLQGKTPLTPDMVTAVAEATKVSPQDVAQAVRPLPPELVAEADHPRWRNTWRTMAKAEGDDEGAIRLKVSYEAFALAARQTGAGTTDWRARLQQIVQDRAHREDRDR